MNGRRVATVFALAAAIVSSCDNSSQQQQDPLLANGWPTNCLGPEFGKGSNPQRPVFKVSDQLVLAIPPANRPSANSIEKVPRECKTFNDLPLSAYLTFLIVGDWSAGCKSSDIPLVGGVKQFQPDVVSVDIDRVLPGKPSAAQEQLDRNARTEYLLRRSTGKREMGRLTCFVPKSWGPEWTYCSGRRSADDPELTLLTVRNYGATAFVLLIADYFSLRHGGIHVNWMGWTSDESHALDIDAAIWQSIEGWNLANRPAL